ncbi:MAG: chemotaxis protein CheW [bacterium]|nr:MAG: chemotaxis protein CheW [bacterium]
MTDSAATTVEKTDVRNIDFTDSDGKEGKYLTFILGKEEYGLEILKVREIISVMEITEVPQVPPFIKGVINLRGKVIPVIDLRLKFDMPPIDYTRETCIIVVNVSDLLLGIVVDTVAEVLDIGEKEIDPPPSFGTTVKTDFILGMGKIKGKVKILLDIDKVLSVDELDIVAQAEKVGS